jgi:hypothetical protein
MNDLDWIKYFPTKMFCDTAGMTAEGERAHRRLFDFLLIQDGRISSDDEVLRQVSSTAPQHWGKVKRELLARGWVQAGEWFFHRGTIKSLNESKEFIVSSHNRTAKANQLPRHELSAPDPITGVVAVNVAENVTEDVTGDQRQIQEQEHRIKSPLSIPSLEEVLVHADRIGVTAEMARQWFADRTAEGWCDRNGVDIGNWRVWLTGFRDRARSMPKGISPTTEAILREKELKEVEAKIKSLTGGDAHSELTGEERTKLRTLQARR